MNKKHAARAAIGALSAAIILCVAGCSGGGGTASGKVAAAAVPTYITDNLSTDYSKVWVGVRSIAVVDADGAVHTLYTPEAGVTSTLVNLSELSNVAALMGSKQVPMGAYTKAVVTLDDTVALEPVSGAATINATFGGNGGAKVVELPINLTVTADTPLVIDFNLSTFEYDAATNTVTPTLAQKPKEDIAKFEKTKIELEGVVTAVGGTNGTILTVTSQRFPDGATVQTDDRFTTIFGGGDGASAAISVGARVEVRGNVRIENGQSVIYAVSIKVKRADERDEDSAKIGKLVGSVASYTAPQLVVAVREANFLPGGKTVSFDLSNATYVRGTEADLLTGAEVRVMGQKNADGTLSVKFVDVVGGETAKEKERGEHKKRFNVSGRVTDVSGGVATVNVAKFQGPPDMQLPPDGLLQVSVDGANYESGDATCLLNSVARMDGVIDAGALKARMVGIRGGCGVAPDSNGVRKIDQVGRSEVSARGILKASSASGDSFQIEVFELHGFTPAGKVVTVQLTQNTRVDKEHIPSAGDIVEVVGTWDSAAGVLNALKVEKDD